MQIFYLHFFCVINIINKYNQVLLIYPGCCRISVHCVMFFNISDCGIIPIVYYMSDRI